MYLYKRDVAVEIEGPHKCEPAKLSSSVPAMSKCLRNLNANENLTLDGASGGKFEWLEGERYELGVEPDLDQLLIEGDTLELTCRFRKMLSVKKPIQHRGIHQFQTTKLSWTLRSNTESRLLKSTLTNSVKLAKHFISIVESSYKLKNELVIESKLIIKRTEALLNTGKYICSTLNSNKVFNKLNATSVDIKVVNRNDIAASTEALEPATNKMANTNKSTVYCEPQITQTYKGVYSWPKTFANTSWTQKCLFNENPIEAYGRYDCDSAGKWVADSLDLSKCEFESNLTRLLKQLTSQSPAQLSASSNMSIGQLINQLVKHDLNTPLQMNAYDILYVQRFLFVKFNKLQTPAQVNTWRRQFVWLTDLLARSSPTELTQARSFDANTFGHYFVKALMPVLTYDFVNDIKKHNAKFVDSNDNGK